MAFLSPPKKKCPGENQEITSESSAPISRKSSLKSPSNKTRPKSIREHAASFENLTAESSTISPPPRSPSRVTRRGSPIKTSFEFQPKSQTVAAPIERPRSDGGRDRDDVDEYVQSQPIHPQTIAAQLGRPRQTETNDSEDSNELFGSQPGQKPIADLTERSETESRRVRDELDDLDESQARYRTAAASTGRPRSDVAERIDGDEFQPKSQTTTGPYGVSRSSNENGRPGFQSKFQTTATPNKTQGQADRRDSDDSSDFVCMHRCRSTTPKSGNRPTTPGAMTQIDGSPERQQPLSDLDPIVVYRAGPGVKVLNAPSTLRSQPRRPQSDLDVRRSKTQAGVQRTSSAGSTSSEYADDDAYLKKSNTRLQREQVAPDQLDGAADLFILSSSCRGSFMDLRGEFERKAIMNSSKQSLAVSKSGPHQPHQYAILTKRNAQPKKGSWTNSRKTTPRSALNGRGQLKPAASKVRGLAAMFDTAAKDSPLLPTPGGAIQKKRRETARVISPYTRNPSPRASITSVSTPVSLMKSSRISIDLTRTGESSARKSMIPHIQNLTATGSTGTTKRRSSPTSVRREESRFSLASSNAPSSRNATPSRLPIKKKAAAATAAAAVDSPYLSQYDGTPKMAKSPLKLTAQQEIRPVAYHPSPVSQVRASGGCKVLPRLSQHSTASDFSERIAQSGESSPISPHPNRGGSASSLRNQIRSLRMELSSKNEDCAQLHLELEESRKSQQVNEILLQEDLAHARADTAKWRSRAERAERKVDTFERLAMQMKNARDCGHHAGGYHRGQAGDAADDYSFNSGSDHIDTVETPPKPLIARINQSVRRRTPPANSMGANGASGGGGDGFSECSNSTVVRNVGAGTGDESAANGSWLSAVDELVDFASPRMVDERL